MEEIVSEVLAEFEDDVEEATEGYKALERGRTNFLVRKVMERTDEQHPAIAVKSEVEEQLRND